MSTDRYILISAQDAYALLQANTNAVLVDVRSDMEYLMIGHPVGAVNIPWIDAPDWVISPEFVARIRKLLLGRVSSAHRSDGVPVVLICRSDNRSRDAAQVLIDEAALRSVYVIEHGFEGPLDADRKRSTVGGWRKEGLPWEQC